MDAVKRVVVNTGFLYARMGITIFISLYSTRLVLGALGEVDFGIFNIIMGSIAMLLFLNAAMVTTTQRFMSIAKGEENKKRQTMVFNVAAILHLGIAVILMLILEIAAHFLFNGVLSIPENRIIPAKILFRFMMLSAFFSIISVPYESVINAHENMLFVAVLGIFEALIRFSIAIFIILRILSIEFKPSC